MLGCDETSWNVSAKGRASWTISRRPGAPRKGERFLKGFTGSALGDARRVHRARVKDAKLRIAFCWVHARRRFIQAEANDPVRARQLIEMVQEAYAIEEQAPPRRGGDELRRRGTHHPTPARASRRDARSPISPHGTASYGRGEDPQQIAFDRRLAIFLSNSPCTRAALLSTRRTRIRQCAASALGRFSLLGVADLLDERERLLFGAEDLLGGLLC